KNIDALEKRVIKLEGDVGRLRKTPAAPAPAGAVSARPDSSWILRLDSLLARVKTLEAQKGAAAVPAHDDGHPVPAANGGAAASDSSQGEIASLIREVKTLTALLRAGRPTATPVPAA